MKEDEEFSLSISRKCTQSFLSSAEMRNRDQCIATALFNEIDLLLKCNEGQKMEPSKNAN